MGGLNTTDGHIYIIIYIIYIYINIYVYIYNCIYIYINGEHDEPMGCWGNPFIPIEDTEFSGDYLSIQPPFLGPSCDMKTL